MRVLGEEGGMLGQVVCKLCISGILRRWYFVSIALTLLDAGDARLLCVRGDGSVVGGSVLRGPVMRVSSV